MRLLLFADVHANGEALLSLQRAERRPDAILFAGDAVGYGPEPVQCARWLIANYEAGDMVVHSPYMVHASTVNLAADGRMRLSTDIRYQRVQDEIDARWQNHWSLDDML